MRESRVSSWLCSRRKQEHLANRTEQNISRAEQSRAEENRARKVANGMRARLSLRCSLRKTQDWGARLKLTCPDPLLALAVRGASIKPLLPHLPPLICFVFLLR